MLERECVMMLVDFTNEGRHRTAVERNETRKIKIRSPRPPA